jgi:hypothetical protein
MAVVAQDVNKLQGYKRHIVSDFLGDRYPYLEDITSHLKRDEVSMAHGDRLFPRLVAQLEDTSMTAEVLVEALRTVCDLCAHQENKSVAISTEVVEAATNLLTHDSIEVRRDAARVITSCALAIGGRVKMPIGNTNMPSELTTGQVLPGPTLKRLVMLLLGCDDEQVKMNVAEAMSATTVLRDGCQQVVEFGESKGISQYICATLPTVPPTRCLSMCLLYLLTALAKVAMYAHGGIEDIIGIDLLAKVVGFLSKVPNQAIPCEEATEIVRQALRLLWHSANDARGRKEMLKADGIRVISGYLKNADAGVREAAVCAISVISLETTGKKEVLTYSKESLATMLFADETPFVHQTSVQLARAASELPAFRYAFARHILQAIWLLEEVYGTTALAAVSPLLRECEDINTRTQAAQVMLHFLTKDPASPGDMIRVPPVTPLYHIEHPCLFCYEECVDVFHDLIALLPVEPAFQCLDALTNYKKSREGLKAILRDGLAIVGQAELPRVEVMLDKTIDRLTEAAA